MNKSMYETYKTIVEQKYQKEELKNNLVEKQNAIAFLAKVIRNGRIDDAARREANEKSVHFIDIYLADWLQIELIP